MSPYRGAPSPEVTGPFCRVPFRGFSRSPWYSLPAHLCRFWYGHVEPPWGLFSGAWFQGLPTLRHRILSQSVAGFRPAGLRSYPSTTNGWDPLSYPVPPAVLTDPTWYGNINPLSIAYAFRPRLRSRLT